MQAARRLAQKRNRIEQARSRYDNREWVVTRRARTKHLIELGGLVAKAGLVALADDDRAMLYGAFLDLAQQFRGSDGDALKLRLKRRGARAFADESETASQRRTSARGEDGTGAG